MKNILIIKANNRPDGVSTKMYETFLEEASKNKNLNIETFDVFKENMPYYGQDLFNAFSKLQSGESLNEIESLSLQAKEKAQLALSKADTLVFAFPLWNLTIPAALQSFIDYNLQSGFTFKYNSEGKKEFLLADKKVILLNARGGVYSSPEMNSIEMSVNYMRMVMQNFFGFEIIDEVIIEGHAADPVNASNIISEGLDKVKLSASKL